MNETRMITLKIVIIFIVVSILFLIPTNAYAQCVLSEIKVATGIIDPGDFEPPDLTETDAEVVTSKASKITNVIGVIGIIVSVISLILIGIKFMTGSIEEKAEYKKSMIPYLIGVFIFFALTQLLRIIINISENFDV